MNFVDLPVEILKQIVSELTLNETLAAMQTCREMYTKLNQDTIWKERSKIDFGDSEYYYRVLTKANVIKIHPSENFSVQAVGSKQIYQARYLKVYSNNPARAQDAINEINEIKLQINEMLITNGVLVENRVESCVKRIIDLLEYYPWEIECFQLLACVCFILGKYEEALVFVEIGLGIYYSYHQNQGMVDDSLEYCMQSQLKIQEGSINAGSSSNGSRTNNGKTSSHEIHNELLEMKKQCEGYIEYNTILFNRQRNGLSIQIVTVLEGVFQKFDINKDDILDIGELERYIYFVNQPEGSSPVSSANLDMVAAMKGKYKVGGNPVISAQLRQLIGRYGTKNRGLDFSGFCEFYYDQSVMDPMETLQDIEKIKRLFVGI